MIKRSLWVALGAGLILTACKQTKKGSFSVSGTYRNADKLSLAEGPVSKVYLMEVSYGKDQPPVIRDSAKLQGNSGSFNLSAMSKNQGIFELVFGNGALDVPVVNDATDIKVSVDLGKKDDFYDVSGSEATNQLKDLINVFGKKNFEVDKSMADLDSLQQHGSPDSAELAARNRKNAAIQDLNTYLKQFITTNSNPTLCALALGWASRSFSPAEFEASLGDMVKKYPNNNVVMGLKQMYDQQMAQMAEKERQQQANSWVGQQAPELSLPDASGRNISLASFKGKYLLVDFWASWCGPCRAENPNVVNAYQEFKGKNFAILGVSLDKEKALWQQAIREDKLEWTHVSDLAYWSSKAVKTFHIEGIPFNVLIDPQGKIIAQGLRGEMLESKLREVLH